jgi:RHS repeat-associated protein
MERLLSFSRASTNGAGSGQYTHSYAYNKTGNITSFAGVSYAYNGGKPHAVTHLGGVQRFWYDANGNMTKRVEGGVTYDPQVYDVQNRLVSVTRVGTGTTTFAYDAAGIRVKTVRPNGDTIYTPFPTYEEEVRGATTIKRSSYGLVGQTIALRVSGDPVSGNNRLFFYYVDHLGSTSIMLRSNGDFVSGSTARYHPFGGWRTTPNQTITDRGFTGHAHNNTGANDLGLVYMGARFYLPGVGRFLSADVLVPDPTNPQQFNRYSYVLNNALRYTDPSGRYCYDPSSGPDLVGTCVNEDGSTYSLLPPTLPSNKPPGLTAKYGEKAWSGLNTLQNMTNAWWGIQLDALEAMMILLDHEFGVELYWLDFPQDVIDVAVNKYNLYCQAGPWSASCMNGWWGYSQVIREHTAPPGGGDRLKLYPDYVPRLRELAQGVLNHRVQAVNTSLTHYGNAFGSTKDLMIVDYQNGVHKYSSYLSLSGPNSIFAIQTDIQHCRTGTLEDWSGIERSGCGR